MGIGVVWILFKYFAPIICKLCFPDLHQAKVIYATPAEVTLADVPTPLRPLPQETRLATAI